MPPDDRRAVAKADREPDVVAVDRFEEVVRGVGMHADVGGVARFTCDLVFAIPIRRSLMMEKARAVRVDRPAAGVGPDIAGAE